LLIRVAYLGKRLYCEHCGGPFFAADSAMNPPAKPRANLLERAEQLLADAEQQKLHGMLGSELVGGEAPAY
jgi:hypothetical protein